MGFWWFSFPKYQKFKVDVLPRTISYEQDWKWNDLIPYYETRYGKTIKPMFRRTECDIPDDCTCPVCNAPKPYLSWNDGRKKSQIRCKVCLNLHSPSKDNRFSKSNKLRCPHCSNILVPKKNRKHFVIHKSRILNALTIFTTLRRLIKRSSLKIMAKINTNSTTSIVNFWSISFRWI